MNQQLVPIVLRMHAMCHFAIRNSQDVEQCLEDARNLGFDLDPHLQLTLLYRRRATDALTDFDSKWLAKLKVKAE